MRGRGGFTLAELLTVMALIALIGGLSASAYQVARRNYALQGSAGRIQGILRAARNSALLNGTSSTAVVDPVARTVTAQAYERVGEWSFENAEEDASAGISIRREMNHGGTVIAGRVGKGLSFRAPGAYYECGAEARFDLRSGILIDGWVRHSSVESVRPPRVDRDKPRSASSGTRRARPMTGRGARNLARGEDTEAASAIVKKDGAYFLGMTRSGALEGKIGAYRVRTAGGVVLPERWVHIEMRYDGKTIELSADGVPREAIPMDAPVLVAAPKGSAKNATRDPPPSAGPPSAAPVTTAPLLISSSDLPFPGEIDEVRLGGSTEPVLYSWPEHERVIGWKKVIHFDRRGHLEPAYHADGVRLVLVELPEEDPKKAGSTTVVVDYSIPFEEWTAKWEKPPDMRQRDEEARLEAGFSGTRTVVIEVDRLGVIR